MRSDGGCALALVAAGAVAERTHGDRLSEREAAHLAGLSHPRVRRRWLAGRLAAKCLLLGLRGGLHGDDGGPLGRTRLVALDGESLRALSAERCREIEVLPVESGPPRLAWRGHDLAARVSISHGGGFSCAAVASSGAATGLDLEAAAPRAAAFYRGNFTPRERRWAEDGARTSGLSADWLYTFLWTLKEAALKSGVTPVRSVWEIAGLEIRVPADLPERLAASRRAALGECFATFETLICAARRCTRARIETTSTPEAVLSLLTAVEASR
jgi:phosphopantetheinyl transferase